MGAFFIPTRSSMARPVTSKMAMAGHTIAKKRRSTCVIRGSRCGGASCSAAAARSANSIKPAPPSQVMAAAMCRNFIRADMAGPCFCFDRMRARGDCLPGSPIVYESLPVTHNSLKAMRSWRAFKPA